MQVGRVKKFASALRSGKLSAQQLVEEFKKQYNAELDLTHCYVTKSAASATAAGSASERGADEVNFEWIEKELTRIITEHDPDNLKGVKKLVSRLKSGKMPFNKVRNPWSLWLLLLEYTLFDRLFALSIAHRCKSLCMISMEQSF